MYTVGIGNTALGMIRARGRDEGRGKVQCVGVDGWLVECKLKNCMCVMLVVIVVAVGWKPV